MDNNPDPSLRVEAPADNLWISREEYERLKQQAALAQAVADEPEPVWSSPTFAQGSESARQPNEWWKLVVVTVAGVLALLAFSSEYFGFLAMPLVIGFMIVAAYSLFSKGKGHVTSSGGSRSVLKIVLLSLFLILAVPVIGYIMLIALFIVLFTLGGGRGS